MLAALAVTVAVGRRDEELVAAHAAPAEAQVIALLGTFSHHSDGRGGGSCGWSDQLLRTFGIDATPTREQVLALVHDEDRDGVRQTIERLHADRQPFAHDYRSCAPTAQCAGSTHVAAPSATPPAGSRASLAPRRTSPTRSR